VITIQLGQQFYLISTNNNFIHTYLCLSIIQIFNKNQNYFYIDFAFSERSLIFFQAINIKMKIFSKTCIVLSIILLTGCTHYNFQQTKYTVPKKPKLMHVELIPIQDLGIYTNGYYINSMNTQRISNNIEKMKTYIKNLELLLIHLQKKYNIRFKLPED